MQGMWAAPDAPSVPANPIINNPALNDGSEMTKGQ